MEWVCPRASRTPCRSRPLPPWVGGQGDRRDAKLASLLELFHMLFNTQGYSNKEICFVFQSGLKGKRNSIKITLCKNL